MSDYSPLRDAFSDINKMMLDKRQWDSHHEKEMAEMGLKSRMLDMQVQEHNLKKKRLERQAQADEEAMREVPVNIYNYFDNNDYIQRKIFDDSDAGMKFARVIAGPDATVDRATGMVYDMNGNTIRLPQAIGAQRAILGQAVIASQLNPEEMIGINLETISAKQSQIEKELKAVPMTDVAKRKELQEQLSQITTTRNKHTKMLSPEALEPYYRQQLDFAESMALKAAAMGVDERTLSTIQNAAQRASTRWVALQGRVAASQENVARREHEKTLRAMDIQSRKELKALENESKKDGKSEQKYIGMLDEKGQLDPKTVTVFNPEKIAGKVSDPPPGYVYTQAVKDAEEIKNKLSRKDKLSYSVIANDLEDRFKTSIATDEFGREIKKTIPADMPRLAAAKNIVADRWEEFKSDADASKKAYMEVIEEEKALQEDAYVITLKEMQKPEVRAAIGEPTLSNPKFVDFVNNNLKELSNEEYEDGGTFASSYGYIPKVEHRESLDRALAHIPPVEVKE